jgi:hypothetical protein
MQNEKDIKTMTNLNETTDQQKTALKLADIHLDLDKKFSELKNEVKNMDVLYRQVNKKNILKSLKELNSFIAKFNKKYKSVTGDYEIDSTIRIYRNLIAKIAYAIDRTNANDFSWAYLE